MCNDGFCTGIKRQTILSSALANKTSSQEYRNDGYHMLTSLLAKALY